MALTEFAVPARDNGHGLGDQVAPIERVDYERLRLDASNRQPSLVTRFPTRRHARAHRTADSRLPWLGRRLTSGSGGACLPHGCRGARLLDADAGAILDGGAAG